MHLHISIASAERPVASRISVTLLHQQRSQKLGPSVTAFSRTRSNGARHKLPSLLAAAPEEPPAASTPAADEDVEVTFYEGNGSNAETVLSVLLGITLIYLPLTLASLGRRLWVSYRFTNKRIIVTTSSPVFKREVQVKYSEIKEVRSVGRGLGLWGDMVIFLKDGSRLELVGIEKHNELRNYVEGFII